MAFLNKNQLQKIGFKYIGLNVKISDKAQFYQPELMKIGNNSRIDDFCVLSGNITIGNNVHIATFCNLNAGIAGITIRDFAGISSHSNIVAQTDDFYGDYLTGPTVPQSYRKVLTAPIFIEKHVIVGTNCTLLPGVKLEEGCTIGAMSLVTKSTSAWMIYKGIPAKPIKARSQHLLLLEKKYLENIYNDN